jgi:hypothetical protein
MSQIYQNSWAVPWHWRRIFWGLGTYKMESATPDFKMTACRVGAATQDNLWYGSNISYTSSEEMGRQSGNYTAFCNTRTLTHKGAVKSLCAGHFIHNFLTWCKYFLALRNIYQQNDKITFSSYNTIKDMNSIMFVPTCPDKDGNGQSVL